MGEQYPVTVARASATPLFDPENAAGQELMSWFPFPQAPSRRSASPGGTPRPSAGAQPPNIRAHQNHRHAMPLAPLGGYV